MEAGNQKGQVRDITPEECAIWVSDEFCKMDDILDIAARIEHETRVIEDNAHRANEFPMAHFAHMTLLQELQAHYDLLAQQVIETPRILH